MASSDSSGAGVWVDPTPTAIDELAAVMSAAEHGVVPLRYTIGADCGARWNWDPVVGALPDERLNFLLEHWRGLRGGRAIPLASEVDPVDLGPILGFVMLLDILEEGYDCRYRLYGTGVSSHAGRDWTGSRVSEMNRVTGTNIALFYRAGYRASYLGPRPLYTWHRSPSWITAANWSRLVLPLAGSNGAVTRFLVGNIPGDLHYLSPEEEAEQERILRSKPAG